MIFNNSKLFLDLYRLFTTNPSKFLQESEFLFFESLLDCPVSMTTMDLLYSIVTIDGDDGERDGESKKNLLYRYFLKCKSELIFLSPPSLILSIGLSMINKYQSNKILHRCDNLKMNSKEKERKSKLICLMLVSIYRKNASLIIDLKHHFTDFCLENFKTKEAVDLYSLLNAQNQN